MQLDMFTPFPDLARDLLAHALDENSDGSHDLSHLMRVWSNVVEISAEEGGDLRLLLAATLMHDCVHVEKTDPRRSLASRMSADRAETVLADMGWAKHDIAQVTHAIVTHSYSAGLVPQSLEAEILQDADRLHAIGLVGVARCFYVAGRSGAALYDPEDPRAEDRDLNDRRYALDHFETKLLKLSSGFLTGTGKRMAGIRHTRLERFRDGLLEEICRPG